MVGKHGLIGQHFSLGMAIETTVFDFKISKTFDEWRTIYDSENNKAMLKAGGITSLYRGLHKEDSSRAIVIFQAEEGVAMGMWNDPEAKVMIESSGHIYDETAITQWIAH
ncbi:MULTISPECIES: DUF3764 family protein [unclassified Prochlorococcus]|uniref:DUF3764 family protein n=2 Tax=unclassified Prochlorococcus TaxID=2627481 RepID=UPI000ADB3045|nr:MULTISPECIES: DUF3764 family protein [unclassified Prochlorococcus]